MNTDIVINLLLKLWVLAFIGNWATDRIKEKLGQYVNIPGRIKPYLAVLVTYGIYVVYIQYVKRIGLYSDIPVILIGGTAGFIAIGAHDILDNLDDIVEDIIKNIVNAIKTVIDNGGK